VHGLHAVTLVVQCSEGCEVTAVKCGKGDMFWMEHCKD
jgi:hypothetical protein